MATPRAGVAAVRRDGTSRAPEPGVPDLGLHPRARRRPERIPSFTFRTRSSRVRVALVGGAVAVAGIGVVPAHADNVDDQALAVAQQQIGDAQAFGGTGPDSFDCSGLTQYSLAQAGRSIPRTAQQQYDASVHKSQSAKEPGDLIFFSDGGSIYHVGIYEGGNNMIAVSSSAGSVQRQAI